MHLHELRQQPCAERLQDGCIVLQKRDALRLRCLCGSCCFSAGFGRRCSGCVSATGSRRIHCKHAGPTLSGSCTGGRFGGSSCWLGIFWGAGCGLRRNGRKDPGHQRHHLHPSIQALVGRPLSAPSVVCTQQWPHRPQKGLLTMVIQACRQLPAAPLWSLQPQACSMDSYDGRLWRCLTGAPPEAGRWT